jgi:hypothetical protein
MKLIFDLNNYELQGREGREKNWKWKSRLGGENRNLAWEVKKTYRSM